MSRARTVERRKEREQQRKKQRQLTLLIGVVAVALIAIVLLILINQPAEAPIPAETATRYEGITRSTDDRGIPSLGSPDAPVKVMEYSSFDCTHCKDFHDQVLPSIVERVRNGEVQFTFVPMYATGSISNGLGAARAAACAGEQGKFWEMHDALFNWQGLFANTAFSANRLATGVTSLGLDKGAWDSCMAGSQPDTIVNAAMETARLQNVSATPSVFVNGTLVPSPGLADVTTAITQALAQSGAVIVPATPTTAPASETTPEATAAP